MYYYKQQNSQTLKSYKCSYCSTIGPSNFMWGLIRKFFFPYYQRNDSNDIIVRQHNQSASIWMDGACDVG